MSDKGEIYTAGKYFTLPVAVTAWTNSTSVDNLLKTQNIRITSTKLYVFVILPALTMCFMIIQLMQVMKVIQVI